MSNVTSESSILIIDSCTAIPWLPNPAWKSAEVNEQVSKKLKGKTSPNKGNAGKYKHSDERKKKMSDAKRGKARPEFSDEWKANISAALTGIPRPRRTD